MVLVGRVAVLTRGRWRKRDRAPGTRGNIVLLLPVPVTRPCSVCANSSGCTHTVTYFSTYRFDVKKLTKITGLTSYWDRDRNLSRSLLV